MTRLYTARGGQLALFPGAKTERQAKGNRGMELEHELLIMHALYRRRKLAEVYKNPVQCQPVGNGQWARITGKAIVDFTGCLAGGRHVAFDAKDCAGTRIELNRLAGHQIEYLGSVFALGGLAFVLVRFEYRRCYRIPIDCWAYAYRRYCGDEPTDMVNGWKPKNIASICEVDMKPEWAVEGVDWMRGVELWPRDLNG